MSLIEKWSGHSLSKKAHVYLFLMLFFVCSCFLAWVDESDRGDQLGQRANQLGGQVTSLESQVSQKAGSITTMQEQLVKQQTTVDNCLLQLGKNQPEPPRIITKLIGYISLNPITERVHTTGVLGLTNRVISPVDIRINCNFEFDHVEGGVLVGTAGTSAIRSPTDATSRRISDHEYRYVFSFPIWAPDNPLLLRINILNGFPIDPLPECKIERYQ